MTPPSPPPPQGTEDAGRARSRRTERRAVLVGLAVSVAVHVGLVWLYPGIVDRVPDVRISPSAEPADLPLEGIEIVTFREVEDEPAAVEEEPPPQVVVELPEPADVESPVALPTPAPPAVPVPGEGVQATERDPEQRTAAERLRPQLGDPRLWAPLERAYMDLTDEERAEIYLRGMITDWNDSVAVAVALSEEATDWTYTDDEGRRWGLSPGRLHLGDFSIPLPFSFQGPSARHFEVAQRNWELRDIMRGTATAEVRQSWAERAREIRERLDAERAATQSGGGPPGSEGGTGGTGGGGN